MSKREDAEEHSKAFVSVLESGHSFPPCLYPIFPLLLPHWHSPFTIHFFPLDAGYHLSRKSFTRYLHKALIPCSRTLHTLLLHRSLIPCSRLSLCTLSGVSLVKASILCFSKSLSPLLVLFISLYCLLSCLC